MEKAKSTLEELLKAAAINEDALAKELQETKDFSAHFEAATQGKQTLSKALFDEYCLCLCYFSNLYVVFNRRNHPS